MKAVNGKGKVPSDNLLKVSLFASKKTMTERILQCTDDKNNEN